MSEPKSITEILPGVIRSLGLKKKSEQLQVLREWGSIVGEEIFKRTKPVTVKKGVLKIMVDGSAWMNELQLLKPEILSRIEAKFGKGQIKDIRFVPGKIDNKT